MSTRDDTPRAQPLPYPMWGEHLIDVESRRQMDDAMRLPISVAGALLPDAHVGYGVPIGGVIGGEVSARLIPVFGWESIFIVGGIAPFLLAAGRTPITEGEIKGGKSQNIHWRQESRIVGVSLRRTPRRPTTPTDLSEISV